MISIPRSFTLLEQAVLRAIWTEHLADRAALEIQLATATGIKRENTGVGFFTYFCVERIPGAIIKGRRLRDGPTAQIQGFEYGMDFILWLDGGYASCLEGYTYGGESTAEIALDRMVFTLDRLNQSSNDSDTLACSVFASKLAMAER